MPTPLRWWIFCAAALLGVAAQGQVLRCTDARTGQVTYTDGVCASGTTGREVEGRKSAEEILRERQLAAQALERKQQRLQTEEQAAQRDAEHAAQRQAETAARAAAAYPTPQDYARSPQCAHSRRSLDLVASSIFRTPLERAARLDAAQRQMDMDCLGPEGYAEVEKARAARPQIMVMPPPARPAWPAQPAAPPRLTHCTDFTCFDSQGRGYPRAGPGRLPGPEGTCRSAGGRAPC